MDLENLLNSEITFIAGLVGIIFVLAGIITYYFPPKEINALYGYRTSKSMKSHESWVFAQTYSAVKMMQYGSGLVIVGIVAGFIKTSENIEVIAGLILILTCALLVYYKVENELSKRF